MLAEINEIVVGLAMMVLTTIIHAMFMVGGMRAAEWKTARFGRAQRDTAKAVLISVLTA